MATVNDPNQAPNPNQQTNQPTTGGTSASGSGTGKGVGTQQTSQVQQNQAPQNGQGYADVGSYLNANPTGGQQLGQQVASNLNQGYQSTLNNINNSVNTANSSINQGYTPENTQLIQQVAANPTAAAADNNLSSQFQGQLNDVYGGPTSWSDYGTQQGNVQTAQQNANLVNTPGGNNALIQQVENQQNPGQTSQGINTLDTLLYQGNPNAVATAQTAANQYGGLTDYLNQANTGVQSNIAGAQTNAQNASQDALNAFTGANGTLTNLNTGINSATAKALSDAQAQQAAIKADIGNLYGGQAADTTASTLGTYGGGTTPWGNTTNYTVGNLSPQDLQAMGMSQDQWNALQGQLQRAGTSQMMTGHNFGAGSVTGQNDLNAYLNQLDPTQAINAGNVATKDQYAQMAAIQQLLGAKNPQGNAINPLNSALAGTYNPNNLNQFDYNAALGDTQTFADTARQQAQAEANALTGSADLAHAASQHGGGFFGGLKEDITHPLSTLATISNPMSWPSNALNLVSGHQVDPYNMNQPFAKTAGTVAGGILGSIFPGVGTAGGALVGGALGAGGEYLGQAATKATGDKTNVGDTTKSGMAHGGDVNDYLDKRKK